MKKLPILCIAFYLGVSFVHSNEINGHYKNLEKFMRDQLPPFIPKQNIDNVLDAMKGRQYEEFLDAARLGSELYTADLSIIGNATDNLLSRVNASKCFEQVFKIRRDLKLRRPYAAFIDDSNGKMESGLYRGNYQWLGRYYQCVGLTDMEDITTKMCLVTFGLNEENPNGIRVGQCVPRICTEEDISELNEKLLLGRRFSATAACPKELPFTPIDIALIVILSVLATMVIVGTIVEATVFNPTTSSGWLKILVCFSMIKNNNALFRTKRSQSSIPVLDGIRFLSMTWVVLGHTFSYSNNNMDNLVDSAQFYISHIGALAVANSALSVDSFFFLSGLLVTYLALRKMRSNNGKLNVPLMYLQRYLRLTPVLIFAIMFTLGLSQKIGGGLLYQNFNQPSVVACQDWWWTNILYINNLVPKDLSQACIGWTWYLANDMQFFIVSPIFIYLLYRYPKAGMIAIGVGVLGSSSITGALTRYYEKYPDVYAYSIIYRAVAFLTYPLTILPKVNIPAIYTNETDTGLDTPAYWSDIYAKPWCRIGVYFIGMLTGYILYVTNNKLKMRKIFVAHMWVIVVAVELAVVYGWWGKIDESQYPDFPSYDLMAFYEAVRRPLWGFGLMWITIACTSGYGGPVNSLLSWKGFIPLSRLTYSTYMFHLFVVTFLYLSREVEVHLRIDTYIYYFLATLVLSMSGGYVVYLLIEAPVAELQKILLTRDSTKTSSSNLTVEMKNVDVEPVKDTVVVVKQNGIDGHENEVDLGDEVLSGGNKL